MLLPAGIRSRRRREPNSPTAETTYAVHHVAQLSRQGNTVTDHTAAQDHASVVERPTTVRLPDLGLPSARNSFRMEAGANVITVSRRTVFHRREDLLMSVVHSVEDASCDELW
jgi:hypothetical protein